MAKKKRSALSARDKMIIRKEELKKRAEGQGGGINFIKEGVTRVRIKSPGEDEEIGIEIIQFYLGKDLGGAISPATFDEPCPLMEAHKRLKESNNDEDKELAKELIPRRRYVIGGIGYKDEKGKEIDQDRIDQGWLVTGTIYQSIVDLWLDEDEWGDMTDPEEGYDVKITRAGSGKMDTTYSLSPCQKKPLASKYQGYIDLESIVRGQIKSYDELSEILNQYLGISPDGDDDDFDDDEEDDEPENKPKKKKKRSTVKVDKTKKKGKK